MLFHLGMPEDHPLLLWARMDKGNRLQLQESLSKFFPVVLVVLIPTVFNFFSLFLPLFLQVLFALNQTLLQHESLRAGSLQAPYTTEDLIKHYNCGDLNAVIFNHDTSQVSRTVPDGPENGGKISCFNSSIPVITSYSDPSFPSSF